MWYLFNSAYRPLYAENALRTLFLPAGSTNDYRYKFRGDRTQIAPGSYDRLKTIQHPAKERVAISFIDRYSDPYTYHPLRLGRLVGVWEEDDYFYIRVQLEDFVSPHDATAFSKRLLDNLAPQSLARRQLDPEDPGDGYYVVSADSLFEVKNDFHSGSAAWVSIVERLEQTKALKGSAEEPVVFCRAEIVSEDNEERLAPRRRGRSAVFDVTQGLLYKLRIAYRFPIQRIDRKVTATVTVKPSANLQILGNVNRRIGGYADRFEFPVVSIRYPDEGLGSVSVEFSSATAREGIGAPNGTDFLFRIRESRWYWVTLAAFILVFGLSGVVVGINPDKLPPGQVLGLPIWSWLKGTSAVLQAAMLLLLFRQIGKKAL